MKKFVYSAVALATATGASYAADTGWASLDQEISGLSSSLSAQNAGGPKVGGWVITSVRSQDGNTVLVDDGAGGFDLETDEDQLGFNLDQVRLHVTGDVSNDYSYKVSFELESGSAELKDAYIKWKVMDSISATMGQFYVPTLRSATRDESTLLFLGRTNIGAILNDGYDSFAAQGIIAATDALGFTDGEIAGRDTGIMIGGNFEMVNFGVAIQNGADDTSDEFRITLNVSADVMGKGAGAVEGAYGSAEGTNLSVGGFYHMDDGFGPDGNDVFGLEGYFTMGAIAVSGEYADFDALDASAYNLTASYLFTEMYEAAVRYEDNDDIFGTQISVGVNRYSAGHNLKWTLQYVTVDAGDLEDVGVKVEDQIAIGATLAF
jgi:hypothetical protein